MLSQFSETIKTELSNSLIRIVGAPFALRNARAAILLLFLALTVCAPFLSAQGPTAQGLDPAAQLKPATNTWPTYNGDYSGRRFSPLDQINATNIHSRSEEHTSELQSQSNLVCRLLLEKKKK